MAVAYLDHQRHVCTVCVCVSVACCAREGLGASSENRKQEAGERAVGIARISGEHELKCVCDSLKRRWSVGDVGPQAARLSHSRVSRALHLP